MVNVNNFLTTGQAPVAADRAVDAWRRINDKATSITIVRGAATLTAQTVRVELNSGASERGGDGAGISGDQGVVVFGVKSHPTQTDTDIQRGDLFAINGKQYRVKTVLNTLGEVQAFCEALT